MLQLTELLLLWLVAVGLVGLLLFRVLRLRRALNAERREVETVGRRLEALVAASPFAIFLLDEDARVRDVWNPAAERMFGWSRAEVEGRVLPIVPPGRDAEAAEIRRRAFEGGRVTGLRVSRIRRDGMLLELSVATAPVGAASGPDARLLVMMEDVTARVIAEARINAQAALIDNVQDPILATDADFRITLWNPAAERLYGWSAEEAVGRIGPELLRTEALEGRSETLQEQLRADRHFDGEVLHRRRDGTVLRVEARTRPLCDADGRVSGWVASIRDVTARRAAEAALRESEARIRRIADNAADLIFRYRLEPDRAFEYVSPSALTITGYTPDEHYADPGLGLRLVHPEDRALLLRMFERPERLTGEVVHMRWIHRDGRVVWTEQRITAVRDATGKVAALEGIVRDITRERELDEQLRQAQKMEAIGQLTGGIAHDFNNLLAVILANTALVRDLGGPGDGYMQDIQGAALRGSELVRKLLAFGRRERLDLQPLQLDRLTRDFVGSLRRLLPEGMTARVHAAPGLPPVRADRGAIEQILLNLVTNARDAMPGGGELSIEFAAEPPDPDGPDDELGCVRLSVRDRGTGMDANTLARVFDPFFTTKQFGKGTGLGMAMVYGLMQQLGGAVEVESEPGTGTAVHLWFPATREPALEPEGDASDGIPGGRGELILLAEDEEALRRAAVRILEGLGYRVLAAGDGIEALEMHAAHAADIALVVTDVAMPRLNGTDLLDALRRRGAQVPVLFASGYAAPPYAPGGEAGLRFLEKPWTVDQLARGVRDALDARIPLP